MPSQSAKNDTSGPSRHSSITSRAPAAPNCRSSIAARIAASGFAAIGRDDDALAGREAVGLDHDRKAELAAASTARASAAVVAHAVARGRNAVARHEALREDLAALELRRGARRTEDAQPARRKEIDDAAIERQLGTDDGEIDRARVAASASSAVEDRRRRSATSAGDRGDAGVARRADSAVTPGSRAERHASACSRPPPPTTRTFMTSTKCLTA